MAKKYNSCGQHSAIIEENQKLDKRRITANGGLVSYQAALVLLGQLISPEHAKQFTRLKSPLRSFQPNVHLRAQKMPHPRPPWGWMIGFSLPGVISIA
jgi:hypothetical protein